MGALNRDERDRLIKASWDKTIKEQSMPKTIRYQRTFYTDDDIAKMLGVDRSRMTLVRDSMLDWKRWEIIVEEIIEESAEANDQS